VGSSVPGTQSLEVPEAVNFWDLSPYVVEVTGPELQAIANWVIVVAIEIFSQVREIGRFHLPINVSLPGKMKSRCHGIGSLESGKLRVIYGPNARCVYRGGVNLKFCRGPGSFEEIVNILSQVVIGHGTTIRENDLGESVPLIWTAMVPTQSGNSFQQ
jgi:hypothetical protein